MGKPWAELSSAERLDAILVAVSGLRYGDGTANNIGEAVNSKHWMKQPRMSRNGRSMAIATRVTPGITALRKRGLLGSCRRADGLSGSCDALTDAGLARVQELLDLP